MPRDSREERLINGVWASGSSVQTQDAGDQPGSVPRFDGNPTYSQLPEENDTGTKVGLVYIDVSTETIEVAVPDGSGGVVTTQLADVSASVNLSAGGGLL